MMASEALRDARQLAPYAPQTTLAQPQVLRTPAYVLPPSPYDRAKRAMDLLLGGLLMLPFSVLLAIIAVLIKRDSEGPVFFKQERIGEHGRPFKMYKFRTMTTGNDDSRHRAAVAAFMNGQELSDGDPDSRYKLIDDVRVTRVGKVLRKLSLDELPQLINVMQGSMSLVGPRPPLDYEVERYSEHDMLRLEGKPGMTGWWQVYGRSRVSFPVMVDMDIYYLKQRSLLLDFSLLARTALVVARRKGGA